MAEFKNSRLLRAKEAALYIGIGTRTLWTLTNLRRIPSVRFDTGGRESVRYDVADLDAWIEAQKSGGSR
jgi:excisionase family DNA binding protein